MGLNVSSYLMIGLSEEEILQKIEKNDLDQSTEALEAIEEDLLTEHQSAAVY